MNVNLYGPYRVTRAFAALIIQSKGRIIKRAVSIADRDVRIFLLRKRREVVFRKSVLPSGLS